MDPYIKSILKTGIRGQTKRFVRGLSVFKEGEIDEVSDLSELEQLEWYLREYDTRIERDLSGKVLYNKIIESLYHLRRLDLILEIVAYLSYASQLT